jgi:hypothetical protein
MSKNILPNESTESELYIKVPNNKMFSIQD